MLKAKLGLKSTDLTSDHIWYILNNYTTKPPPYHVTQTDVSPSLELFPVDLVSDHQSVRGRGGTVAVMYEAYWHVLSRPSRERESDLSSIPVNKSSCLLGGTTRAAPPDYIITVFICRYSLEQRAAKFVL